jgi:hypothetical protein
MLTKENFEFLDEKSIRSFLRESYFEYQYNNPTNIMTQGKLM